MEQAEESMCWLGTGPSTPDSPGRPRQEPDETKHTGREVGGGAKPMLTPLHVHPMPACNVWALYSPAHFCMAPKNTPIVEEASSMNQGEDISSR